METIKVNMNPNPLDVQTIHASQNDGEAREWEFELHNNGELIDTSNVTEQMFFKAYKGGTEQLLPENGSTPTTSPFKGDIRYPQGLLSDQEFTYRQSPTEEDGLAKITDIKGNTIIEDDTLISFNGTGIKTVGKNLFDFSQFANGIITFENGELTGTAAQFYTAYNNVVNNGIELKYPKNTQITISFDARTEQNQTSSGGGVYLIASENNASVQLATTLNNTTEIQHITVTIPGNRHIDKLGWSYGSGIANIWHITNFQVEFGATETSYEPYTSSTLSLPISTYFPTGMKSKGDVYDELTENKAITRVGSRAYQSGDESDTSVITDGTTTYYALVTPTETSFTTASLVTENAEIPLSNEDGILIGKCTEELSAEPGFHDAKIKLSDSDGECYSNKIQLHVERSPQ